jgi:iron-sulfur cluster repair protein YtfE (RIC family)
MNAIDLLKTDHDYVDALFKRIEDTPPSKHATIFKRIKSELDTHAHIEEKIFYPRLLKDGKEDLQKITREGLEEHAQIKKLLREIARTTSKDTREAKLKVLMEDTRHHVKDEENEMFPMVEDQFTSEQLDDLGTRMEAESAKFRKSKGIAPRRPAPTTSRVAKVVDAATKVVAAMLGTEMDKSMPVSAKPKAARTTKPRSKAKARSAGSN